jgi:hypothetical protein
MGLLTKLRNIDPAFYPPLTKSGNQIAATTAGRIPFSLPGEMGYDGLVLFIYIRDVPQGEAPAGISDR